MFAELKLVWHNSNGGNPLEYQGLQIYFKHEDGTIYVAWPSGWIMTSAYNTKVYDDPSDTVVMAAKMWSKNGCGLHLVEFLNQVFL